MAFRRRARVALAVGAFAVLELLACASAPPPPPPPPAQLTYAENPAVYTLSVPVAGNRPSSAGGAVDAFSVSPALPAGLALDATTGVISGVPTALAPTATYRITARNRGGETAADLVLTVNDSPPAELAYLSSACAYTRNVPIAANVPSHTGGAVASYAVTPALPAGLSLDTATGVISGTPTTPTPEATYTVTATNPYGSASAALVITVSGNPPRDLAYSTSPGEYIKGIAITPNIPHAAGGAVTSYAAESLPPGLQLDPLTGAIYGTPTAASGAATYRITATNEDGSATIELTISVVELVCTATRTSVATSPGQTESVQLTCTAAGPYWVEYAGVPAGAAASEPGASATPGATGPLWPHQGSASWTVSLDPGTAAVGDYPLTVNVWRSTARDLGAPGPVVSWGIAPSIELIVVTGGVLDPAMQ